MVVRMVLIAVTALSAAAIPSAVLGQVTEQDHAQLFVDAIRAYADYRDVPLDQVYIDTVACGRLVMRGPVENRPRLVTVNMMRRQAREFDLHLVGEVSVFPNPRSTLEPPEVPIRPDERAAYLFFVGMEPVTHDSVVVTMRTEQGVLQNRRAYSDLMRFTFKRQRGEWVLLERKWETGDGREW